MLDLEAIFDPDAPTPTPAATVAALACDTAASDAEDGPIPDLSRILPPVTWLTPTQRGLWRERTVAYEADGMARPAAEQEAMAELVCTGELCEPGKWLPWPGREGPCPQPDGYGQENRS